jgi:hypothetical protein
MLSIVFAWLVFSAKLGEDCGLAKWCGFHRLMKSGELYIYSVKAAGILSAETAYSIFTQERRGGCRIVHILKHV